jgi:hypothetical protein
VCICIFKILSLTYLFCCDSEPHISTISKRKERLHLLCCGKDPKKFNKLNSKRAKGILILFSILNKWLSNWLLTSPWHHMSIYIVLYNCLRKLYEGDDIAKINCPLFVDIWSPFWALFNYLQSLVFFVSIVGCASFNLFYTTHNKIER